jgi:dipeptidyl aminopeptidase/acylaminoacyl peptidase
MGLAAAACCLVLAPSAQAQEPGHALIAYEASVEEGHSEIYLVASDGSGRRRLTGSSPSLSGKPSNVDPAWAPDGNRLAYTHGPETRGGATQIRIRDVATGADQALAAGADGYSPAWSPDGTRIAFLRQAPDRQEASLYVMSADGSGTAVKIADDAAEPEWAHDGRRILFSRASLTSADVYAVSPDGSGLTALAHDAASPSFSPDGTRIAFVSGRDRNGETCFEECSTNAELYVMNADGSGQTRLTHTTADEENPRWSADGARIAFDSDQNSPEGPSGGGRELYSVNADGSCMTWITNGSAVSRAPSWQPGAGRATDPGPVCGAAPRSPTFDVDTGNFARFKRFRVYWLGPRYGNLLLSAMLGNGPIYADCATYTPGGCGPSIQIQNRSTCERNPLTYGGSVPERVHWIRYRGGILAFFPSAEGWDFYTGRTTVTMFVSPLGLRQVKAIVKALRLPRRQRSSGRPLPPPAFPDSFWRRLDRLTARGHERALARTLGSFGHRRQFRCPRDLHPPRS